MRRNRRSRSRSRSPCYGLKKYGIRDTRGRTGMERSTLSGGLYATGRCKRGSESRHLYMDVTKRHSDICADDIREHRRQRYSDVDSEESLVTPCGQRCITPDRLSRRQENNFGGESDHELHRYRYRTLQRHEFAKGGLTCRDVRRDASCDGGRFTEKDEPEEMTYDRRDFDVSFQQRSESHSAHNIPCKYLAKGYCRYGEDCRFSHGEPFSHFGDHKRGYYGETESSLSRKGPKRGDQVTNDDASRSSRWRHDHGKQDYGAERDDSLSWDSPRRDNFTTAGIRDGLLGNSLMWEGKCKTELETTNTLSSCGPKRGNRTKIEDSPDSSQRKLHGKQDYNGKTSRRFSRNGSKGGDSTTTKNATNSGKLSNSGRIASNASSWNHSKWGAQTTAMVTPNSSIPEDDKQDPDVKVDKWNGPIWGDLPRIKETPNSFQWTPDADVGSVRSNNTSPRDVWGDQTTKETVWKGPKWGNQTTKETSWDGPKWSDHQTEYAAAHKPPQETSDDKLGENVKTGYCSSLDGSKWGEHKRKAMKDASRYVQCIPYDGKQDSEVETRNGVLWDGPTWEEQSKTELETQTPNSLSTNDQKWSKQGTLEDSFNPSRQRLEDNRPDYNGKTSRSFSRNGSEGGRITTKDATNSDNWGNCGRIASASSWDHPKCCERTTSRATPNSSTCRSDVKADKSNGPKWCDQRTKKTTWKGPTWGDEKSRQTSWHGPKWGDQTTKETSGKHRKWVDQTSKETSCDGPKWTDHQAEYAAAHKPPEEISDDKLSENVKTGYSLSLDGSKWGEQDSDVETCNGVLWDSSTWKEKSKNELETQTPNDLSTNDQKWSKQRTLEDSFNPSQQRLDDNRPDYNGKTSRSFSRNGSEGGLVTTKNATNSDNWGNCGRNGSTSSWDHPSSTCRSDDDKQGSDVKADKSNGSKWCHQRTKKTTWKGPMWGDETSRETSWDGPKWGDQTSRKHRKLVDQTSKETSCDGPKWGDHQSTKDADAHTPSQESPDNGKGNNNVKTEINSTQDGPNCCKQKSIQHSSISPLQRADLDRQYHNVKTDNNLPLHVHVSREGDQMSVLAPFSSQPLSDADNWGNVKNDYYISQFVQKCGDETVSRDAFISCQRRSDNDVHGFNTDTDKSLIQADPKCDHQMTCKDASKYSMCRSKNAGLGASAAWSMAIDVTGDEHLQPLPHETFRSALSSQEQDLTQVDSGKAQHALTILQPPSNSYTFDFNLSGEEIQDQQNINLSKKGEQTLIPPPHEDQNQHIPQSVAINGKDAIPQPPNQESLNSDLQDHEVLVNSKQTLKPLIDDPYASTPVQNNLVPQATKFVTSDSADLPRGPLSMSFQTKQQTMVDKSLTTAKNSASSIFSVQPDNSNPNRKADKEPKHEELSANEAGVGKETETLQNTNTRRTGKPEDVDAHLKAERGSGKTKDDQWIRMLKFALVEFVKDILKPSWREGHLSKEAHKTIVKKVVDKVTDTLRGPNIPRSQEQIDLYLSYSKTKLSNLVLGYLEIHLKS